MFLIVKQGLYYCPKAAGYTGIKDNAGRFSWEEAQEHVRPGDGVSMVSEASAPDYSADCYWDIRLEHEAQKAKTREDALAAALRQISEMAKGDVRAIAVAALGEHAPAQEETR